MRSRRGTRYSGVSTTPTSWGLPDIVQGRESPSKSITTRTGPRSGARLPGRLAVERLPGNPRMAFPAPPPRQPGVRGDDIMIYDATGIRNVGQPILTRIRSNPNPEFQKVKFLVGTDYNLGGRMSPTPDMVNPIRFSKGELPVGYLPRQVTEAK